MTGLLAPPAGTPPRTVIADDPGAEPAPAGLRRRARRTGGAADPAADEVSLDRAARASTRRVRARRAARAAGVVIALGAIASAGWWGPRALARLSFFRVRRIEIEGARYASPRALAARLAVDTSASVWADLDALTRRVAADPLVAGARVERRPPGVLRVVVRERVPVAVAPGPRGALVVYDAGGAVLPLQLRSVGGVDVPLVATPDPALLRALGGLRADAPRLYARVLEAARVPRAVLGGTSSTTLGGGAATPRVSVRSRAPTVGLERDELDFVLAPADTGSAAGPLLVRAALDVSAVRFADLAPVEADLVRRGVRASELDLRFRDQVVARLP